MKITAVEVMYLRLPNVRELCDSGQDALIVKVSTDAGITGIGEVDSSPLGVKGVIDGPFSHTTACGLAQVVVGEDPFETEYLWHKMYRANIYGGRRGVGLHAMSGIDIALWDIKGKALGLPIWKLLGGGFHEKIRPYASSLFGATPAETGDRARRFRDRGFTAVKFGWEPMGQNEKTDIALVREARRGLGDDADLMIDAGLVWDAKTAIQRARAFSQYDIFWLEEPLMPDDYNGYGKLCEATEVRIAAGEEESNRASFVQLMDQGKIDIVQVDLTRVGGFTEAMKIASLAQAGCRYLQLDDTNLAYLCDETQRENARKRGVDPDETPRAYAALINASLRDAPDDMLRAVHLCRGNFRSSWAAEGGYEPVAEIMFNELAIDAFFLEYDDPRSGDFAPLRFLPKGKTVVLGLVTTKLGELETKDEIRRRIDEAAKFASLDQLALSPQCGFASTVHGNDLSVQQQSDKIRLVIEVAEEVWG